MALGARRMDVLKLVMRQVLVLLSAGVLVDGAGFLMLSPVLSGLLFGVTPTDPITYAVVCVSVLFVGLAAASIPAYRAAKSIR